jgi:transcriptional regulator with XRE-family HTH domain
MSNILDKAKSSVANYEDGSTEPVVSVLRRYVQYFDISYTDLLDSDLERRGVQVLPIDQPVSNEPVGSYKKMLNKNQMKFLKQISDSINDIKGGMEEIDKRLKDVEGKVKSK